MNRSHTLAITLLAIVLSGTVAIAQLDGIAGADGYDLTWHTIDGGGGTSTGGGFTLAGTIGQPDAGTMSGGDYQLSGGFWTAGQITPDRPDPCPADLNDDGSVGVPDLLQLLSCWGTVAPGCKAADLTGSGNVGVPDLLELLAQWGPCE